jgi:hypothetical protein
VQVLGGGVGSLRALAQGINAVCARSGRALRVERVEGSRIVETPERVRLSVRRGMAPPAGAFVEVKAQLEPPLQPGPRGRSFGDGGRAAALEDWCAPFAFGVARLSSASRLRNIPGIEAGFT